LNEDDVKGLIRENPDESTEVEFKEKLSLTTPSDKFEFAKDISAMANAFGGKILVGITKKGVIVGIDLTTFDPQRMHDVMNNRAIHFVDFEGKLVDMPSSGPCVKVGVIRVEKSTNPPVCIWSRDHAKLVAYRREGNTIKELNPDEIKKLSQEGVPRAPSWHTIDPKETGVFNYDFSQREPFFEWYTVPEQDRISPVLPVPIPFLHLADGIGLRAYCGGVSGGWLETLREVEEQIDKHHGIIAECWTIRNSQLLWPLPENMQYFTGPSVRCLTDTLEDKRIDKYGYLSCVFLAHPQLLYLFQGEMNNIMDLNVYSSSIPARSRVVKIVDHQATLSETGFSFINLQSKTMNVDGISFIGADHPTERELDAQPNAELVGYIGQRSEGPFKVRGLHIFKTSEELRGIIREKGGEEGRFLTQTEPSILFSHVSSRMSEEDKRNVKITGLRLALHAFSSTNSTTLTVAADCGIY
jgi:hypothetical protein